MIYIWVAFILKISLQLIDPCRDLSNILLLWAWQGKGVMQDGMVM